MSSEEDLDYYPFRWKVADFVEDLFSLHRGKVVAAALLLLAGIGAYLVLWGFDDTDTLATTTTAPPADESPIADSGNGNEDEALGTSTTDSTTAPTSSSSTTSSTTTSSTTTTTSTTTLPPRPAATPAEIAATTPGTVIALTPDRVELIGGLPTEANAAEALAFVEGVFGDGYEVVDSQIVDGSFPAPEGNVTFRLSPPDLFDYNRAVMNPTYHPLVDQLAATLGQAETWTVAVIGHTDDVGPSGPNQALSQRRAQNGADRLVEQGVAVGRVTVIGAGEDEPIAPNDTEEGRLANRRLEFVISRG